MKKKKNFFLNTLFPGDSWRTSSLYSRFWKNTFKCLFKKSHQNKHWLCFLGAALLSVDFQSAETLGFSAIMFFTWFYVTHVSILTSIFSNVFFNISSMIYGTFRYQNKKNPDFSVLEVLLFFVVSVNNFSLDTSSAQTSIDQWSITISSKDGCFQANFLVVKAYLLPFPLSYCFKTLTNDLGCFPLDFRP